MRVTPTREQLDYLVSIGVPEDTLGRSVGGPAATEGPARTPPASSRGLGCGCVLLVILAVILVLTACACVAWGEEHAQPPPHPKAPENETARQPFNLADAWLPDRGGSMASVNQQASEASDCSRWRPDGGESELGTPGRPELQTHAGRTPEAAVVLAAISCLLTALVIVERFLMRKHLNQVEEAVLGRTPENSPDNSAELQRRGSKEESALCPLAPHSVGIRPERPAALRVPGPREQMDTMIEAAAKLKRYRVRLRHPEGPWTMGLATTRGNVRPENQDYGLCFQLDDDHEVLVIADGCGGVPFGQRAAYVAAVAAAVSVVQAYGSGPLLFAPHMEDAAAQAIIDAAHRLAVEGDKLNVSDLRGGLRTTLIVLVGSGRDLGYAYIGDGGGCVVRASGAVESFLTPQKASPLALNVLAASLGPSIEGEFVMGTIKRMPGDLVIVGTDGVFDRVGPEFPKDVLRGCIQLEGDLQATADHIVEELAAFKDSAGFVCDDNLTVGLLGDGTAPRLPKGFWSTTPSQDTAADSAPEAAGEEKETAR
jgi:serine/threonine protein phosphatase PrpC